MPRRRDRSPRRRRRNSPGGDLSPRGRRDDSSRRRREDSPRRRSPGRRRRDSSGSDGIHAEFDDRRGRKGRSSRSRRDERDGGRRTRSGGGEDEELRYYIEKIYKQFLDMYEMITSENNDMRKNSVMKNAPHSIKSKDRSDHRSSRDLEYGSALEMLKSFKKVATNIGSGLNEDYRDYFFSETCSRDRDHDRSSRSNRRHRDEDRDDRHKDRFDIGGREDRDDRYDRGGRGDRDRRSRGDRRDRDRRGGDRYERDRSSRYERR